MSDFIEDISEDHSKENVQMKTGEITGDQHLFHSLPKEFQQWHATNYLIEKEGQVDTNLVTKSLLNAYSWKTLLNASGYAISTFILIVATLCSEKFFESVPITILHSFLFLSLAIYIAYQFYFFGIIRAQIIGPLTEKTANVTSFLYYQTYFATFLSLIIMLLFIFLFGEDILELIFTILATVKYSSGGHMDMVTSFFFNFGVQFHNLFAKILYNESSYFYNIYFLTILYTVIIVILIYIIEKMGYNNQRHEIIESMSDFKLNSGYPIEKSQMVIKTWREKHGM